MAIQTQGAGGSIVEAGAFGAKGLHTISKPTDAGALGHYRVSVATGVVAAALAANAQVYQFKFTGGGANLAVIKSVRVEFHTTVVFTSAYALDFGVDMVVTRAYAAGGGGTTLTLTGDNQALRASMGTCLAVINVSTTAALTLATTLDAQPIAQSIGHPNVRNPATAIEYAKSREPLMMYRADLAAGEHPLVLTNTEGFVIRNRTVWPAAGTGIFTIECVWAEVTAF